MADVYYSLNRGQSIEDVAIADTAPTADIVLTVNTANVTEQADLLTAIKNLEAAVVGANYPAA